MTTLLIIAATAAVHLTAVDFSGFATAARPEVCDLKAFANADFEDRAKFGTFDGGKLEIGAHLGFNGNGGAKLTPKAKPYTFVLPTDVRLEKGLRYIFSVDLFVHGAMDSATQTGCDVYSKKDGKCCGGFWGAKPTPIGGGWTRCELQVVPKFEPEEVRYRFVVYAAVSRKDGTDTESSDNYALVDNLSIREDVPQWHFSNIWPTHNKVFNDDGNLRSHAAFVGPYLAADADAVYEQKLVKPDGTVLARDVVRPDAGGAMTAHFGTFGYEGPIELVTTLYDLKNRLDCGSRKIALTAAPTYRPEKGEIFVPEDGIPLVDGKPFMPIALYSGFADAARYTRDEVEEHFALLRDAGVNMIMDYPTYKLKPGEEMDWYYGTCARYGIRVLNDDFKYNRASDFVNGSVEHIRARVAHLKKYPAIIGYYTMDEGSEDMIPMLQTVRRTLNEECPGRIVNTCNIFAPATYLSTADIAGGDKYPVAKGRASLEDMESYGRRLRDTSAVGWHAPQAFNWADTIRGARADEKTYRAAGREPTENEMLSVALMYASYGVKGFIFYSYDALCRSGVHHWPLLRWKRFRGVAACLKSLEPFIMSGEKIVELPHVDTKGRTRVVALSDGKGAWRVLAMCVSAEDNACSFTLPAEYGELKSRCGNVKKEAGRYTLAGPAFVCDVLE